MSKTGKIVKRKRQRKESEKIKQHFTTFSSNFTSGKVKILNSHIFNEQPYASVLIFFRKINLRRFDKISIQEGRTGTSYTAFINCHSLKIMTMCLLI